MWFSTRGVQWSVHNSSVRANDASKDKLISFQGDLQGTRVADPRLEAMALKPPVGLQSRCVPSEILDRGSSKLSNLGRGSGKSSKWLTGRALTWWMGPCLPYYAVFD